MFLFFISFKDECVYFLATIPLGYIVIHKMYISLSFFFLSNELVSKIDWLVKMCCGKIRECEIQHKTTQSNFIKLINFLLMIVVFSFHSITKKESCHFSNQSVCTLKRKWRRNHFVQPSKCWMVYGYLVTRIWKRTQAETKSMIRI